MLNHDLTLTLTVIAVVAGCGSVTWHSNHHDNSHCRYPHWYGYVAL